jgi:hypothetical protein
MVWLCGSAGTYASSTVDANIGVVMRGSGVAERPGYCGGLGPLLPVPPPSRGRQSEGAVCQSVGEVGC